MNQNPKLQVDRLDNCKYMMDVNENVIAVNAHTTLTKSNPVKNRLTFQLLNPERAKEIVFNNPDQLSAEDIVKKLQQGESVANTSYIKFFVPYGERERDFIDVERAKLLSFTTEGEGWSASQGVIFKDEDSNQPYMSFVLNCLKQTVIRTLFSLYFHCDNIQSYAPPGQTYVYAEIQNTVGIKDVTKMFPIQKVAAKPRIHKFFSAKTTLGGAAHDEAKLEWAISGAERGELSPDEVDIFSLAAPVLQVTPGRSRQYHLSVKGSGLTTNAYINVYTRPPEVQKLAYDRNQQHIVWQTDYSDTVQMKVDHVQTTVALLGSSPVSLEGKSQAVLKVTGYLYTELVGVALKGYTLEKPQYFSSRMRLYAQYTHTRWSWKTDAIDQVTLQFTEDGWTWYKHTVSATGEFEYVSAEPIVGAKLVCTKADGSIYTTLCLDKEAEQWNV
ncbi:hypothetical protein [Paenibacillus campi]|uniref:hypothetical protein n=1 Tax=Paenibacillus campi TaxID=3106031 RepID=UPI002AFE3877|nr:hypothetical protein [Paenibacillus sp. SGZ-1009]